MNDTDFDNWVNYAATMQSYYVINAICIILLCMRDLLALNDQFPSFGVLFATLSRAKFDLMNFFIVSLPSFISLASCYFARRFCLCLIFLVWIFYSLLCRYWIGYFEPFLTNCWKNKLR